MKKFFYLLGLYPFLNLSASTSAPTLWDVLSFDTVRARVRPLMAADLADARELDGSNASFVQVIRDDFKGHDPAEYCSTDIKTLKEKQSICYGAFEKDTGTLIGLIEVRGFQEDFLGKHTKCHKSFQGKGLIRVYKSPLCAL